jgi:hypothetical protein
MARKKLTTTRRSNWLLVVAGCLALTAIAISYWQNTSGTTPSSPAPMQLKIATAPTASNDVAPAAPSKDVAAAAPVKDTASAPTKAPITKAPAANAPPSNPAPRVTRRDPPAAAATTVERRENAVPPSAPKANKTPSTAETYEAKARVSLQNKDYEQAREHMEAALDHGGKATFMLIHDHSRGNFESDDPKATCVGELTIFSNGVSFEPREDADRFSANWSDVKDAGGNKFFGSGKGGFHVSINTGGKYKNFNLAPESKEKAEGKLILDLLKFYTRKTDRTK